ncbi:MAG: GNAT family N-acetyltransferase [Lachnospiraceae bacterium]
MTITTAAPNDTKAIYELMIQTHAALKHPEWYCIDEEHYILEHLTDKNKGIVFKAVEHETLAAFFLIHIPGLTADNLGHYLNFSDDQLNLVAHMDSAAVHPDFRGLRLQHTLMARGEQWLIDAGFVHLLGTVHPDNQYSLNNFLKLGYRIITTTEKYGGLPRHVMYKGPFASPIAP